MICLIFQDSISQLALILFSMSDFAHSYMSILLYHHKQLAECTEEVEQIEVKVTIKKRRLPTTAATSTSKTVKVIRIPKWISKAKEEEKVSKRIQSIIRPPSVRLLLVFLLLCTKSRLVFVVMVVVVIS